MQWTSLSNRTHNLIGLSKYQIWSILWPEVICYLHPLYRMSLGLLIYIYTAIFIGGLSLFRLSFSHSTKAPQVGARQGLVIPWRLLRLRKPVSLTVWSLQEYDHKEKSQAAQPNHRSTILLSGRHTVIRHDRVRSILWLSETNYCLLCVSGTGRLHGELDWFSCMLSDHIIWLFSFYSVPKRKLMTKTTRRF